MPPPHPPRPARRGRWIPGPGLPPASSTRRGRGVPAVALPLIAALGLTACTGWPGGIGSPAGRSAPPAGATGTREPGSTAGGSPRASNPGPAGSEAPRPPVTSPPGCVVNTAVPSRSVAASLRPMPGTAASRRALAALRVAPRERGTDYCRAAFGPAIWLDLDGNGCSARQDTLRRQARTVRLGIVTSHGTGCEEVLGGTWVDAYSGAPLTGANMKDPRTAGSIQIDHVVSLFDAWVSGARAWPAAKRVQFANDTSVHELYAVAAQTNSDKSYRSVEGWQPAPAARCRVARAVVEVKTAYGLSVTAGERDALAAMLRTC